MLNDTQKDWTLKLFIHNFLKENNLKNSLLSLENEVLQSPNFNQELPIKSNKTFLLEWWNIFFFLYSEKLLKEFSKKNSSPCENLKLSDLFKPGVIQNLGFNSSLMNQCDYASLFNNFNQNPLNTLESFKNLSRSFNNINLAFSNVNNYFNEQGVNYNPIKTESSSVSINSGNNKKNVKLQSNIFNSTSTRNLNLKKDFVSKIRRRSIKNNKIVFVHSLSAAAKKAASEKESEEVVNDEEEIIKYDENYEELQKELKVYNNEPTSNNGKKPRGSRYRGVSRNGNQWQVLIMVNKKKRYVGSYSNEEEAARAYDKAALQNHGTKAKTNFDYTEDELKRITAEPPILKLLD